VAELEALAQADVLTVPLVEEQGRQVSEKRPNMQLVEPDRLRVDATPGPDRPFAQFPNAAIFLQEHWGERWPLVEAEVNTLGFDLSIIRMNRIPSWELVLADVLARLEQALESKCQANRRAWLLADSVVPHLSSASGSVTFQGKLLDADARRSMLEVLARYESSMTQLVGQHCDALKACAYDMVDTERVVRNPVMNPSFVQPKVPGSGSEFVAMLTVDGWVISVVINSTDCPDLSRLRGDLDNLAERRRLEIQVLIEQK
jgi:hypothetical protein